MAQLNGLIVSDDQDFVIAIARRLRSGAVSVRPIDEHAALDESGRPTRKYYEFRKVIAAHDPATKMPDVPQTTALIAIPEFELNESSSIWSTPPATAAQRMSCSKNSGF